MGEGSAGSILIVDDEPSMRQLQTNGFSSIHLSASKRYVAGPSAWEA